MKVNYDAGRPVNVINVARYYYHETVQICGTDDDARHNVRGGLDFTSAKTYQQKQSTPRASVLRKLRSSSVAAGKKRSSSEAGAPLPHSKRSCSASQASGNLSNRVHHRVIIRDYGTPIYRTNSRRSLLAVLEGCIEEHESLRKAGILHRDISINNLLINEDINNPSWPFFLINLDLAINGEREGASGANTKTSTKAFMAIGALLGEQHSFMHDLESFFWVLWWICIDHEGPHEHRVNAWFNSRNYMDIKGLAIQKTGLVSHEGDFLRIANEYFTTYYRPLIRWVDRLRKVVFPNRGRWEREDTGPYFQMRQILQEAQMDPAI